MLLKGAIETYHDLLNDRLAADSQEWLTNQLQRRGLYFGQRPLCTVLRPRFMTYGQYNYIQKRVPTLLTAFHKIHEAAMADDLFLDQFHLLDWEAELVRTDSGYRAPSPISRLDAFFIPEKYQLQFTEYNAETPAAPAYNDVLSDVFYGLPVMRKFMRHYGIRALPARHGVLHALLDCFEEWAGGRRERPRIAILDWRDVPTYSEFILFRDYFTGQGLDCIIVDPDDVEYKNGRLVAGDYHINLIYKRVLINELIERKGLQHPVVRAVTEGAACMVNPFACKALYKKASLAVLSDERNRNLFTREECRVISEDIPWTRTVQERYTYFRGRQIDLVPYIIENRELFVLKPNDDYGGHGIILGWLAGEEEWQQTVQLALREPHIVQSRIEIPSEPYPSLVDDQCQIMDRMQDTAPFIFHGESVYGCLTRLSTAALLNVTAGGGSTVPTFIVEDR